MQSSDVIQLGGMPLYDPSVQSRAITAENKTGARGQGGQASGGRKGSACHGNLKDGEVYTFAEIDGPGVIRHIWITVQNEGPEKFRNLILRFYWDDQETPSVEAPLTDFFGVCHGRTAAFESDFVLMPEGRGFNCYFPMPFAKKARLTVTNEVGRDAGMFFYQVDYTVGDSITPDTPRFHAQFRRELDTKLYEDYVILDGVKGKGRFMGANIGLVDRYHGEIVWWGEGEVKMYIDGDSDFPTICGTGTEDYVGSGWGLGQFHAREMGCPLNENGLDSFYRFHGRDPIYFSQDIKVAIQQIGNDGHVESAADDGRMPDYVARGEYKKDHPGGNFERVDDMCSTAYWYQTLPTQPFPPFPNKQVRTAKIVGDSGKV